MAQSTVSIDVPMNTNPTGHISTDLQDLVLQGQDAQTWCQFVAGLRATSATVGDKPVISTSDALRWLLQELRGG